MKNKLNIIFFSICLMAALLLEIYCIIVLDGETVSTVGIGVIVLIMSYLLLDSIREQISNTRRNVRLSLEQIYHEDMDKWNERCMEIINLQKASYSATKKQTILLEEKLEQLLTVQEKFNQEKLSSLQYIADLQLKFLEGQKKALNIEVNYNNKNTKILIQTIQDEVRKLDNKEQIALLIKQLEQNRIESIELDDKDTEDLIGSDEKVVSDWYESKGSENPNKSLTADEIAALFSTYGT